MKKSMRRVLSLVLALVMLFAVASATVVSAMPASYGKVVKSHFSSIPLPDDEVIPAIIVLKDGSVADKGFAPGSKDGAAYEKKLLSKQNIFLNKISEKSLTITHRYTELISGFGVEATVGELKRIEQMPDVARVSYATEYTVPEVEINKDAEIMAKYAAQITNAAYLTYNGFDGDGIVVAVVDTGINLEHEALQPNELIENPALTKEMVESADTLNKGKYINEKIPFSYDYRFDDDDCTDENGHGTHVSGIIGGYCPEKDFYGAAPAVQLCGMKVFDSSGRTDNRFICSALEDCYRLGVDIVNMSLGSPGGFTYENDDPEMADVVNKMKDAGILVFASAGNEGSTIAANSSYWDVLPIFEGGLTMYDAYGVEAVPAYYNDYGLVGGPSTYEGSVSVASANNAILTEEGICFSDGGPAFGYNDSLAGTGTDFKAAFEGETLEFVYIDSIGELADYEGIDVEGKLVAVNRGTITFQEKLENAAAKGAVGLVVVNNVDESSRSGMTLTDPQIPAIMIILKAKDELLSLSGSEVTISFELAESEADDAFLISSFSSVGPAPDLSFKPQVTGIGGNVYSCYYEGPDSYVMMSGTSMSCPNVAGSMATLLQYIRELGLKETKIEQAELAKQMLLSTTNILYNDYGFCYTPRSQGAGLADVYNAVASGAILLNPTVSLGDDPECTGVLELEYQLWNLTSRQRSFIPGLSTVIDEFVETDFGVYNTGCSVSPSALFGQKVDGITALTTTHEDGTTEDGTITVDGGEIVTVNVTVQLNPSLIKAIIEGYGFEYGFFYDGFLSFYDMNDYMMYLRFGGELYETCHGSFISYIGDWTAAPAMESVSLRDMIELLMDPESYTAQFFYMALSDPSTRNMVFSYAMQGFMYDYELVHRPTGIYSGSSYNGSYSIPYMNAFMTLDYVAENGVYANTDYLRFSTPATNADDYIFDCMIVDPALLRNVKYINIKYTDEETGEIYYRISGEIVKDYIDPATGAYAGYMLDWHGEYEDENGKVQYVPSGTRVTITIDVTLDYPGAEPRTEQVFNVLVDYEAPEMLYEFDAETNKIKFYFSDNDLLAGAYIYDERAGVDGVTGLYVEEFYQTQSEAYYEVDVSESIENGYDVLYVEVMDYASNIITCIVPISESNSNIPVEVEYDLPEYVNYIPFVEDICKFEELSFMVYADDAHCFSEDFKVVVMQGEQELEVQTELDGYDCATCTVMPDASSDDPVVITVEGVMEHDFQPVEILGPNCTFQGLYESRCTNCNHFDHLEGGTALGHTKDEGQVIVAPTCTDCGWIVYHCTECGETFLVEPIACVDHTAGEAVVTKEPDYGVEGETTVFCTECGKVLETAPIEALAFPNGDVNGDGVVDAFDYMLLKASVLGTAALTADQKERADVNADHGIDAFDYMMLKTWVVEGKE